MDRADIPLRQSPLWLSVVSVALIVAAVVGALAATQRLTIGVFGAHSSNALGASLNISTSTSAGLLWPSRAYFTPDDERIALTGAVKPCQQFTRGINRCGHGLAIYDAHTGALIQMLPIEPLLGVTTPADSPAHARGSDGYVHLDALGWSPDSTWFAMVYTVFDNPAPTSPDDILDSGLLLVNPQAGGTRVIRGDSGYFTALGGKPGAHPIWRLSSSAETTSYSVAPGLIFAWNSAGLPFPTAPVKSALSELPPNAGARYPVGDPDIAAPFTIWQPGVVIGPGSAQIGGRSAFVTTFPSWTTDGASLGEITVGLALPTPVQANATISAPSGVASPAIAEPATLPAAPARDVALARVQEAIGAYGWAAVAWNPTGGVLASVICFARKGQSVELRDTASGSIIGDAPLNLRPGDPGCGDANNANLHMTWSHDGAELLVVDRAAATLTLWTVNKPR